MQEDGLNSGFRNIGRFFLFLIPWALAVGLMAWLGFWVALHQYHEQVAQEQRAAQYVGAEQKPQSKIRIQVLPHDCTHVARVDVDGENMIVYAENNCHRSLNYMEYHWAALSPDGTAVASGYDNNALCPIPTLSGQKAECRQKISNDDRIATIQVWTETR